MRLHQGKNLTKSCIKYNMKRAAINKYLISEITLRKELPHIQLEIIESKCANKKCTESLIKFFLLLCTIDKIWSKLRIFFKEKDQHILNAWYRILLLNPNCQQVVLKDEITTSVRLWEILIFSGDSQLAHPGLFLFLSEIRESQYPGSQENMSTVWVSWVCKIWRLNTLTCK